MNELYLRSCNCRSPINTVSLTCIGCGAPVEDRTPQVTRADPPDDREILTLYCDDSPARPGNEPQKGDSDWTLKFPLSDGRRLHLHAGKITFDNFVAMMAAYAVDEAESQ